MQKSSMNNQPLNSDAAAVLACLEDGAKWEPRKISQVTKLTRQQVNRALYEDLDGRFGVSHVNVVPPFWQIQKKKVLPAPIASENDLVVIIDLGHIHDCLTPAAALWKERFKADGDGPFKLVAYAGTGYEGRDAEHHPLFVRRATEPGNRVAGMMALIDLYDGILAGDRHIIIASKSKLFRAAAQVLAERFQTLSIEFVSNWAGLRMYLE